MPQVLLEQVPAEWVALPPGQTLPHPPQLLGSEAIVRQVPLQQRCPAPQAAKLPHLQTPLEQMLATVGLHVVKQAPQLEVSWVMSRQTPLQQRWPLPQAGLLPHLQEPPTH